MERTFNENSIITVRFISQNTIKTNSENMVENPIEVEVSEKDKPFILALASVGLFAGEVAAGIIVAITNPKADISILKEAFTFTIGLVSAVWTYYFVKKNNEA